MLADKCYAFSLLLQHSTLTCLKEKFFGGRGPSLTYYGPALDLPLGGFGSKLNTNEQGLKYFIPTKFGEYPSSDSVVKSDYVFPYIYMH